MSILPPTGSLIPVDAPFSAAQESWLAGFIAGIAAAGTKSAAPAPTTTVDVLFGTQTGNAESLADQLVAGATARGLGGRATALDDVSPEQLAGMSHVLVVTSTYGEGEMPDNAGLFWDAVQASTVPRLEGLQYAVLGLGDTSYDEFCQAGKLIDTRFEQLGATRVHDRVDCDVDFEDPAALWTAPSSTASPPRPGRPRRTAGPDPRGGAGATAAAAGGAGASRASRPGSQWTKRNPYPARLVENRLLSDPRSAKEIRHYEFDLGDSGITYAAGDALAVVPRERRRRSSTTCSRTSAPRGDEVFDGAAGARTCCAPTARSGRRRRTSSPTWCSARRRASSRRSSRTATSRELDRWLWGRDVLDLLRDAGRHGTGPRRAAAVPPPAAGTRSTRSRRARSRTRTASTSPWRRVRYGDRPPAALRASRRRTWPTGSQVGDEVGVYLQPNAAFRVPADDDAPLIMVGPGTGIAPFRGFLHERAATRGDGSQLAVLRRPAPRHDFVYADELDRRCRTDGVLTRLDLAFSRDQAEKVYVQTRMREQSRELYAWLEDGATFTVCGDASRMAKDVEAALLDVIATERGRGADDAVDYLADLRRAKRYVRDVY